VHYQMLTSDTDKPPLCSPPGTPRAESGDRPPAVPAPWPPPRLWHHWCFLALASAVVAASLAFSVRGEDHVVVPIVNRALPGTCAFRRITGVPCPGCGMTRSFISTAHGKLADAWRFNPAGVVLFSIVAFQIPYRLYQICRIRRGLVEHYFTAIDNGLLIGVVVILLAHWICGLTTLLW